MEKTGKRFGLSISRGIMGKLSFGLSKCCLVNLNTQISAVVGHKTPDMVKALYSMHQVSL